MPDGSKWDVPAEKIAENRADYYSDGDRSSDVYEREFKYALANDTALEDWASNDMNWDDVSEFATKVEAPSDVDYQEGWVNGPKEVIEK